MTAAELAVLLTPNRFRSWLDTCDVKYPYGSFDQNDSRGCAIFQYLTDSGVALDFVGANVIYYYRSESDARVRSEVRCHRLPDAFRRVSLMEDAEATPDRIREVLCA